MLKKLNMEEVDTRATGAEEGIPVMVVVVDVTDTHGEVADMVAAADTAMARDVQGVVPLLMKPLMLDLKMIPRIDHIYFPCFVF